MSSVALTPKQKSDAQKDIVQEAAVRKVVKHFKTHNRGQLAMFCGTGKTRTAIKAIKRLKSRVVVVCVPTLGLASQWINDFAQYGDKRELLAVCSKLHNESPEEYGIVGYTTNEEVVRAFAKSKGKLLIVSTYQSYDVIQATWRRTKLAPIDLLIADEAHNTAGKNSKHMGLCLHDSGAKVVKRLFMTATRRLYLGDNDDYNCMDDTAVYGDVIYELTLREAIDRGIVSDYAVYVINVYKDLRPEDFAKINSSGFERELLAKFVSEKIMKDKAVRVFTFHNRVEDATKFAQHIEASGKWAKVLTGEHKVKDRESALRTFQSHKQSSLIASVNVLGEGIDVPSNDVIVFADKMTEPQAIIQRIGRGTRMVDGKKKLRIVLPICVAPNMSESEVNELASKSLHKAALNVLRALGSYDPKFYRQVSAICKGSPCEVGGEFSSDDSDSMLWFDGVSHESFHGRLLPIKHWPEVEDALLEIETSIQEFFAKFKKTPSHSSGDLLCPESFIHWGSVNDFLRTFTTETLASISASITGFSHYVKDALHVIYSAFDSFVKVHKRAPQVSDGTLGAPTEFKTWKRASRALYRFGTSLSKIANRRGLKTSYFHLKITISKRRMQSLARKKILAYYRLHGRLQTTGTFIFGRTIDWFKRNHADFYAQIRSEIGMRGTCTKSEAIRLVRDFFKKNGRPPIKREIYRVANYCSRTSSSFSELVKKNCGITNKQHKHVLRLQEICQTIRDFASVNNRKPMSIEFERDRGFVRTHKPFGISVWSEFVDHVLSMPAPQKVTT